MWAFSRLTTLLLVTVMLQFFGSFALAKVQWVELSLTDGTKIKAAFGVAKSGNGAAVIFNHGTGVRHFGHSASVRKGDMNVIDYVKALNAMGYTAIAPIRTHLKDTAYRKGNGNVGSSNDWIAVVKHGMDVSRAARNFLAGSKNVDRNKIAIMGFSEGGNVTLWAASKQKGFRAVILLAPATIREAKKYTLKNAASPGALASVGVPVFLGVGKTDAKPIRKVTKSVLIPNLAATGKPVFYRTDYPGGHKWFYKPRKALLSDLKAFLAEHLR